MFSARKRFVARITNAWQDLGCRAFSRGEKWGKSRVNFSSGSGGINSHAGSSGAPATAARVSEAELLAGKYEIVQASTPYHAINCDGNEVLMAPALLERPTEAAPGAPVPWRLAAALDPIQRRRLARVAFAGAIRPGTDQTTVSDNLADFVERRGSIVELVEGAQVGDCLHLSSCSPSYEHV